MKYTILSGLLSVFFSIGIAQTSDFPIGARSAGMANTSVALTDLWAIFHNQAALANIKKAGVSSYYENRFLIANLNLQSALVVLPTSKLGTIGLDYSRFGNQIFNQSRWGLAYAKKLFDFLSIGLKISYLSTNQAENSTNQHNFIAEIGLLSHISPKVSLGFHVFNVNRSKLKGKYNAYLPMNFRLGLIYNVSEKVKIAFETEKNLRFSPSFKAGLEYQPITLLFLRLGIATQPFNANFGVGLKIHDLYFDIAGSVHPVLGFSPKTSLTYRFKLSKK